MSDLTQAPPELARLAEAVQHSARQSECLERCLDDMQQGGLFTPDEMEAVQAAIVESHAKADEQQRRLSHALNVWEKDIVGMERHLAARQQVIERYESVAGHFPSVMDALARTQLSLTAELDEARHSVGMSASTEPFESCTVVDKQSGDEPLAGRDVQRTGEPAGGAPEGPDVCTGDGDGESCAAATPE